MAAETPPANIEIEQALIGYMLVDYKDAKHILTLMEADWFYGYKNKVIYELLRDKITDGLEPDMALTAGWLTEKGILAEVGGMAYLTDCMGKISTSVHLDAYINELRKLYFDRQIIASAKRVSLEPTFDNLEILRQHTIDRDTAHAVGVIDIRKTIVDDLDALTTPLEKGVYDVFGLKQCDEYLNAIMPGNVLMMGARPGVGKTVMATQMVMNFAKTYKEPVLYFSTEMSYQETLMRILCPITKVPGWKFRKRIFNEEDLTSLNKAGAILSDLPIFIQDKPSPSLSDIRTAIMKIKPKLVVIDYIQRLRMPDFKNKHEAIEATMVGLKNTMRDTGVMGVVLSQLDRETDHITGRQRPQLADLKGSGALEAESDSVILIWKHNKKDKDTKKGIVPEVPLIRPVEFIFAKNRHGTSDVSVQMVFDEKYIEFREFDDEEETRIKDSAFGGNKEKKHEGGYSDPIE